MEIHSKWNQKGESVWQIKYKLSKREAKKKEEQTAKDMKINTILSVYQKQEAFWRIIGFARAETE